MTESQRLETIRRIAENNNAEVNPSLQNFIEELKVEKLAEDLVLQYGLLNAKKEDVQDEVQELASFEDKAEEDDDFDNDENLSDMKCVSSTMREIFGE